MGVARRHGRLAGELLAGGRAVAGTAGESWRYRAGGVPVRRAARARVRVVKTGRAISGGLVADRPVSGTATWTAGSGKHPWSRRRPRRIAARPGESAASRSGPRRRSGTGKAAGLREAAGRGPWALAGELIVAGRGTVTGWRTAGTSEGERFAPVVFTAVGRIDQASRREDRRRRQHPVRIGVGGVTRP
jgi:hypothetical protein